MIRSIAAAGALLTAPTTAPAQDVTLAAFLASLPVAFIVTAILHCNNLRDVGEDRVAGPGEFVHFSSHPEQSTDVVSDGPVEILWLVAPPIV